MIRRTRHMVLAVAALVPAMGGAEPPAPHEQGRAIYNFRCYYCHGYSGNAKTLAATFMTPKPRDFTKELLPRERMLAAVSKGIPNTGMAGFENILSAQDIALAVDFVRQEFMIEKATNTHYHTVQNGWPDHERYRIAYPFALGDIPLDRPDESLTPEEREGKALYLTTCISCHDRAVVGDEGPIWETRPVSFPRGPFKPGQEQPDAVSQASPYARHDVPPQLAALTPIEKQGESLYQKNCAFCHAADGSGQNWIGRFLEPHPRDLTDDTFMSGMTAQDLAQVIREGLPGTSMPAWKSVLKGPDITALIHYIHRAFHPLRDGVATFADGSQ